MKLCYVLFDDIFNTLEISAQLTLHVFLKCLVQGRALSKEWFRFCFLNQYCFDFVSFCEPKEESHKTNKKPNPDLLS